MRNMIGLTREEKEKLVLDLYYIEGKTYPEIAKEARYLYAILDLS